MVKKTLLEEYNNPRGKGIIALTLEEGDELITVRKTDGKSDFIIGTMEGFAIRFNEEDVRPMGRTAKGSSASVSKEEMRSSRPRWSKRIPHSSPSRKGVLASGHILKNTVSREEEVMGSYR